MKRNLKPGDEVPVIRHREARNYVGYITGDKRASSCFPNMVILKHVDHGDGTWTRYLTPEECVHYVSHRIGTGKYVYQVDAGAPVYLIESADWDSFGFWAIS